MTPSPATAESKSLLVSEQHGGLWVEFNRPERRNALDGATYAALIDTLRDAATRDEIAYVAISGTGPHFCSGGDLDGFDAVLMAAPEDRASIARSQHEATAEALTQAIWDLPQPLILAARGYAVGAGAQLVLAADISIVSDSLRFSIPQVRLAHTADHGESWYLPRRVGMTQAMRLILLGEQISGKKAFELGIACEVVPDDELDGKFSSLAKSLSLGASAALRESKRLLRESWMSDLASQSAREREALCSSVATPDFEEAIAAFSQKRSPVFWQRR